MPTLDELRGRIEHRKYIYDSCLMDMPINWENVAAMVSGIADAQNEYIAALEADRAAQQQRIAELTEALEPFALMGEIFVNSTTIHPSYKDRDREIYSLNDAVLTRGNFEDAYHLLHADAGDERA